MESDEYDTSKSVPSEDQSKNIQEDELANSNIDTNEVDIILQMEEEAKVRAAKQVAAMLRRPELIEKVKRLKKKFNVLISHLRFHYSLLELKKRRPVLTPCFKVPSQSS